MDKKMTYVGLLSLRQWGEADDILFLSSVREPLADELSWMQGRKVTVRYWITDKQCSREEAAAEAAMTALGAADVEFGARYGDMTGYLWTDEELKVGGHDLMAEFRSRVGNWLILEIELHE